jgi:hypothetical protein
LGLGQASHDLFSRLPQGEQLRGDRAGDGFEVQAALGRESREQRVDGVRSMFRRGASVLG